MLCSARRRHLGRRPHGWRPRAIIAALACAGLAATTGCARNVSVSPVVPPAADIGPAVDVWVTSADRTRLLSRETGLRLVAAPSSADVITVDPLATRQAIVGFGAAMTDASAFLIEKLPVAERTALMQELFGRDPGLGLGFVRIPMGASDFSMRQYSYDDMPAGQTDSALANFSIDPDRSAKLPLLEQALALNPDLKLMASPWSAPGWMKTTGSLIKGTLRPEAYGPFAEYFRRFIDAYAAEGVPIFAISLQNEPAYEPDDYPGMRLDPSQRADVVANYMGPLFEREGIRTIILDWDHNWDMPQQPLAVLGDASARRYIAGVAWHCYGGDVSAQRAVHDAYPDADVYFSECSGGGWDPSWASGLKWFVGTLVIDAVRDGARGVAFWNLALDPNGGPHTGGCGNCRGVVTIDTTSGAITRNVEYYALGHASRFVRAGAHRIESSSDVDGLKSVAFRNADDRSTVLVVFNGATSDRTFAVHVDDRGFGYTLGAGAAATFHWNPARR